MPVSTETGSITIEGDGVTTTFDLGFPVIAAADMIVTREAVDGTVTDLVLGVDFTMAALGLRDLATLTYPVSGSPLPSGARIYATRQGDKLQNFFQVVKNSGLNARSIEDAFDRMTLMVQDFQEQLNFTLRSQVADVPLGLIPRSTERANKYAAFDEDGALVMVPGTNEQLVVVPVTRGGTGAANVSGAQQNLSVRPGVDVQVWNAVLDYLTAQGFDAKSGNTTRLTTAAEGALVSGNFSRWDADGNLTSGISMPVSSDFTTFTTSIAQRAAVKSFVDTEFTNKNAIQPLDSSLPKLRLIGYARINAGGTGATDYNPGFSAVTRTNTGTYEFTFDTARAADTYMYFTEVGSNGARVFAEVSRSTTAFTIRTLNSNTFALADTELSLIAYEPV